jgi:hypothetical protein
MRAVTVVVSPPSDRLLDQLFSDESRVRRDRIYNLTLLEDGTFVLLGRVQGDLAFAREVLGSASEVIGFSISGQNNGRGLIFVHARPPSAVERLLKLRREYAVFFDFPIEMTKEGQLEITIVGERNDEILAVLDKIPPEIDVTVERIGAYIESPLALTDLLTERQREILDIALKCGYYEVPRQATHRDIAGKLGISPPTVSEHLQKIEARIFRTIRRSAD